MKVKVKIKNLSEEFNFKSNVNPLDIIYHAKKYGNYYMVTMNDDIDTSHWKYSALELARGIRNNDFEII